MKLEMLGAFSRELGVKEAQLDDLKEILRDYAPELIGAGLGGGLGAGAGWASSDPETRRRKMFIGGLLGALLGAGGTHLGRQYLHTASAANEAAEAVRRAADYAEAAADAVRREAAPTGERIRRAVDAIGQAAGSTAQSAQRAAGAIGQVAGPISAVPGVVDKLLSGAGNLGAQ